MDRRALSPTVLVVGPGTVSGPRAVSYERVCAAIDAIDDNYALVAERPVVVDELWASVIAEAAGDPARRLVLVCPGWWSDRRLDRIRRAAERGRAAVIVARHQAYRPTPACLIEIAPEFVLCRIVGRPPAATPRLGPISDVAGTVAHSVAGSAAVRIDVPLGVPGAAELASVIAGDLRGRGHVVDVIDDEDLAAAVGEEQSAPPRPRRTAWALSVGALVAVAALFGTARLVQPAQTPTMLITEGRVTVGVPADWTVRRVTESAGSRRLQAFSPSDGLASILLTQSPVGPDPADTAVVLKAALDLQPAGVFTEFRGDDHRGGRAVVSYTEAREGREIVWAVFVDGRVRIAIGCQQRSTGAESIREHCDEAIRSAHVTP